MPRTKTKKTTTKETKADSIIPTPSLEEVKEFLRRKSEDSDKIKGTLQVSGETIIPSISTNTVITLYTYATEEGYSDPDDFVRRELIDWYKTIKEIQKAVGKVKAEDFMHLFFYLLQLSVKYEQIRNENDKLKQQIESLQNIIMKLNEFLKSTEYSNDSPTRDNTGTIVKTVSAKKGKEEDLLEQDNKLVTEEKEIDDNPLSVIQKMLKEG